MTLLINLGTNTATTDDWLEATKNQSISELVPRNLGMETSTQYQMTAKGAEVLVPTTETAFADLKKTSHRTTK